MNSLQKIMTEKLVMPRNGASIVTTSTAGAAARWLSRHKQTNNGKNFVKKEDNGKD